MSEFIKNNKNLVHLIVEFSCMCILTLYVVRSNKKIYSTIYNLEQRLLKSEQMISELVSKGNQISKQLPPSYSTPPHQTLEYQRKQQQALALQQQQQQALENQRKQQQALALQQQQALALQQQQQTTYNNPFEDGEVIEDVIETEGVYEDNLDEEINKELSKLKLT